MGLQQALTRPIEIAFPSIQRFERGNTGVPYVLRFESGKPGPNVMICALTHGNEVCGAIALVALLESGFRPARGALTVAFNNIAAYERFDANAPDVARFVDEDLNRVWSEGALSDSSQSVERVRARQLLPFVRNADFLLDLHSMHEPCAPLWVCGPREKNVALARRVRPDIACVVDRGHAAGVRLRDYGAFDDENATPCALLIECGQHWAADAPSIAMDAVTRFLVATEIATAAQLPSHWRLPEYAPAPIYEVTHAVVPATPTFCFARPFSGLEVLAKGALIGIDGGTPIEAPYDDCVLIMPSLRHAKPGVTVVRLARRR